MSCTVNWEASLTLVAEVAFGSNAGTFDPLLEFVSEQAGLYIAGTMPILRNIAQMRAHLRTSVAAAMCKIKNEFLDCFDVDTYLAYDEMEKLKELFTLEAAQLLWNQGNVRLIPTPLHGLLCMEGG